MTSLDKGLDPYGLFKSILKEQFWDYLTEETNEYAKVLEAKPDQKPNSRISRWSPVMKQEIKKYFALMLHTTTEKKKKHERY